MFGMSSICRAACTKLFYFFYVKYGLDQFLKQNFSVLHVINMKKEKLDFIALHVLTPVVLIGLWKGLSG